MFDTIILLTGPVEQTALGAALRGHRPSLTVICPASLAELLAIAEVTLRRARLIGFASPVIVPRSVLDRLGFGACNFHPGNSQASALRSSPSITTPERSAPPPT
ncbi:MAG: hypothetical protein ABI377_09640 [Devosia sp.]